MRKHIRFGSYLCEKGLIDATDVLNARYVQLKNNRKIGELAKAKGWLTDDNIFKILAIQEETNEKFGEIAERERTI